MTIYISSDHGGFEIKNQLVSQLELEDHIIVDMGPHELDPHDDYPDYAFPLAEKVAQDDDSLGILICRSGNGMCIAANKVKGAYASLCFSVQHAVKAREDDNANIICLDADYAGDTPYEIVLAFITSHFAGEGTRHERRFNKIAEYESSKNR